MKKSKLIALLLVSMIVLSATSSFAQDSTFKLSDYKNPNYFYQTLDLNFGLNSGLSLDNINNGSKSTSNYFSINSNAGATYSLFKNSPKTQTELYSSIQAGVGTWRDNSTNEKYDWTSKQKSVNQGENLNLRFLKRFYNSNQNYLEMNVGVNIGYTKYAYNSDQNSISIDSAIYSNKTKDEYFHNGLNGSVYIGTGRIEQVQDAMLAMYLLQDLQKLNRESRIATGEDVLALARTITTLKYKRFFDYRLRKIAEITAIDSFLRKNNISGTPDAAYFTSLTDNWNYANNPVRYSGKRIFTGIDANYIYNYNYNQNEYNLSESKEHHSLTGLFLVAGMNFENPISLSWQNSANLKIGAGIHQQIDYRKNLVAITETNYYLSAKPSLSLAADYGFGYYPNSRTWLTIRWWLQSGWDKEMDGNTKKEKEDLQNRFYTYTGPQFNAYYYLSEKLRLNLTFDGTFRFENQKYTYEVIAGNPVKTTTTYWNQQVRVTLTYSLF